MTTSQRLTRILWAYPASGIVQMLLITLTVAATTEQGGLTSGGWTVAANAAAPLAGIPLAAATARKNLERWWPATIVATTALRLAAAAGVLYGWPLPAVIALLFAGGATHRVYAAHFKAAVARLSDGPGQLAALNVRNATAYAAGAGTAGWLLAATSTAATLATATAAVALVVPSCLAAAREGRNTPATPGPQLDRHLAAATLRPALAAAALWAVAATFARMITPITTVELGAGWLAAATGLYTLSAWAARPLMRRVGSRSPTFWAAASIAQIAPWALLDVHPWLLAVPLLVAGPVLHAGQAALEHRIGTAVPAGRQGTGFVIGNGALVLGGLVGTPAGAWLLDHTDYTTTVAATLTLGAGALAARATRRRRPEPRHVQPAR